MRRCAEGGVAIGSSIGVAIRFRQASIAGGATCKIVQ
jgi:hypothetical protein